MEYAKVNKRSWLRDEQLLGHLQRYFGKDVQLAEIDIARIEGYKIERRNKVSGSTVNRELALLKRMFNLAIDWDDFPGRNPVCKVRFFKEFNTGSRVLSPDEEKKLIDNAAPFMQDLIVFGLNTGLRVGEIFSLRWSNVNMTQNVLNVFAHKTWKTRTVPMNKEVRRVINAWSSNRKNDLVFYNSETGKSFVDLKAGFGLACEKAGITGVTWHTLHHTFASRLIERGVDIVTVQQLLGHSTVTVTMRYTHTNLESKKAAVDQLSNFRHKSVTVCTKKQQRARTVTNSDAKPLSTLQFNRRSG
jgi:integrase